MNCEEFVKVVKLQTSDSAVDGIIKSLKDPPGRKLAQRLLWLSRWYNQLDASNRAMVREVLKEAAEMAVLDFSAFWTGSA